MTEHFPQRLKRLRATRRMTQWALADRIGVSDVCVSLWERGERTPTADNLAALSRVFGLTMDYLWLGSARKRRAS